MNLTYTQIARLILEIGWPAAERLINNIRNKDQEVTQEEWDALRERINRPFADLAGDRPDPG